MSGAETYKRLTALLGENAEKTETSIYLDSGIPELNKAISGDPLKGFPVGRIVEIFGPSSSGKTFIATMLMAAAQRAGGIAGFSDHERSFDSDLGRQLGLNTDAKSGQWIYRRPQTFEESIDIAVHFCEAVRKEKLIPDEAPLIWVFDSIPSMIPHAKLFDDKGNRREAGDYNMRDSLLLAKCCSQTYPLLAQFAEDNNMLVLLLNQIRLKPGVMYGNPETTPGGTAAEYYCSARISLGKTMVTNGKKGDDRVVLGNDISAELVKNKTNRPFEKAKWRIVFDDQGGASVDRVATLLDYAIRTGKVKKEDKYVHWDGKKKFETVLREEIRLDPNGLQTLMDLVTK